jgi:hypothetical protein
MYSFVKITDTSTNLKYDWCLQISDIETLLAYESYIMLPYERMIFNNWVINRVQQNSKQIMSLLLTKIEKSNDKPIDVFADLFCQITKSRLDMLNHYGTIFIQQSKSTFGKTKNHIITHLRKSVSLIWPDNDSIELFKWPNCKHWYAKVGDTEVKWEGNVKWNTEDAARTAAELFKKHGEL